jgi:hypothetical protein
LRSAVVGGSTITYAYDRLRVASAGPARPDVAVPLRLEQLVPPDRGAVTVREADAVLLRLDGSLFAFDATALRYYVGSDQVGSPRVITTPQVRS